MLNESIDEVISFLHSKKINPLQPCRDALNCIQESEHINRTNFLIYDCELQRIYFLNPGAASFLGLDKKYKYLTTDSLREDILQPLTYQLKFSSGDLLQKGVAFLNNAYYVKSGTRGQYAWIYASAKTMSFATDGRPKLVYISFVEIDAALSYYLKISKGCSPAGTGIKLQALIHSLKEREIEILDLICAEYTSKEIADRLYMSQAAVEAIRKRLIKKLGVRSVAGLVKVGLAIGTHDYSHRPEVLATAV